MQGAFKTALARHCVMWPSGCFRHQILLSPLGCFTLAWRIPYFCLVQDRTSGWMAPKTPSLALPACRPGVVDSAQINPLLAAAQPQPEGVKAHRLLACSRARVAAGPKRGAQRATIQVGCDVATASASTAAASSTWQWGWKGSLASIGAEVRSWSRCRHWFARADVQPCNEQPR